MKKTLCNYIILPFSHSLIKINIKNREEKKLFLFINAVFKCPGKIGKYGNGVFVFSCLVNGYYVLIYVNFYKYFFILALIKKINSKKISSMFRFNKVNSVRLHTDSVDSSTYFTFCFAFNIFLFYFTANKLNKFHSTNLILLYECFSVII